MLKFSTDSIEQKDRFAHWREIRAKNLFGVTLELEPEKRAGFQGTFSAQPVAGATVVEIHASPYRVIRSLADIGNAPSDSLCIYQQIDGGCWFDNGRGAEFTLKPGDFAISNADLPYRRCRSTTVDFICGS